MRGSGVPVGEQETEGPDPRRGVRGSALSPQGGGSDAQVITGVTEGHAVIGDFHLGEDFLQSQIPAVVEEFVKIRPAVLAPAPCTGYRALSPFIKPCLMPSCRTPSGRESSSKARMVSI